MNVYPGILTGSKTIAQQQLDLISQFSSMSVVQMDIIDGLFADNTTLTPSDFLDLDFAELQVDLHLMTEEPLDYVVEAIAEVPELTVRAVMAQVERMSSQSDFITTVQHQNWQAGLSLDLFTPFDAIDDASWQHIDCLQLMSVEAGFQQQVFNPLVLEKIGQLVELRKKLNGSFEIIIDGGIKPALINSIKAAGADSIVVGSALWDAGDQSEFSAVADDLLYRFE